ncbi:NACHT domain-containing protein [Streptomyces prunicolor]|uniref:NACHT domain-containing protein n=1 Tax=Streptomyces prunicolor TaxID=67348 RepID=UPI00225AD09B|nr:NACHT domain-containing protein [Streptomyces prunicolor]MCX5237074.1 NACHT domain-containing protein [Streptomyces prunicolor]
MDYNYEILLDQRFQKLCQSLLLTEYENVQCFPIGMADGGRDATSSANGHLETIFQVKFSHKPHSIKNVARWITDSLDGELEKIKRLKEMGATRYVLITNAFPTGNLNSGTIDKVNQYLTDIIPMEAFCWWRDDLDRRLDGNFDLKLAHPSLLSGTDMLRLLWENMGANQEAERRKMALNAYFAHQTEQDSTIRFKQAELLPSSLLDLFIDVPAIPHGHDEGIDTRVAKSFMELLYQRTDGNQPGDLEIKRRLHRLLSTGNLSAPGKVQSKHLNLMLRESGARAGAADVLLDQEFNDQCPHVVLEGAPGQGKSTLSQYLAQLQRLRILDRSEDISRIPKQHVASPIMMPFKIELRDLASWMKGQDPWSGDPSDRHEKPRTLEGAISAHVERYSGGFHFSVTDMAFVAQSRPVLIILDALDEVADLEDRHRVVEEVTSAVARLQQSAKRLKVLVTSRPTAVTGAPSFPQAKFDYLTLAAIPPQLGLEYAQKWSKARNLRKADATEISQILKEKMSAPHMAELAKNTMQLSILLSLIYHRGSSLPDKRTELYDAYVDSFFNREVEKSKVVRDNRMLLVSIHQHLAFYMHARAESNRTTGRISVDELKEVVREYLVKQQESEEVLDDLLTGMVERVVALVSRVEGTYEFEVQPLREYFAARYLYDTAPYVPATSVGHGTKPDRFDGIARNPYWMNVTRFFAGCFTKGELLDLAERVCSLCDLPDLTGQLYPRNLALALLQDWVFSQSKPATERVIDKLFDAYGVRSSFIVDSGRSRASFTMHSSNNLALSRETGSSYFIDSHLDRMFSMPYSETLRALCYVIGKQPGGSKTEVRQRWEREFHAGDSGRRRTLVHILRWASLFHPDMDLHLFDRESDPEVLLAMIKNDIADGVIPASRHREIISASLNQADQFTFYSGQSGIGGALAFTRPSLWHYAAQNNYPGIFVSESSFEKHTSEAMLRLHELSLPLIEPKASMHNNLGPWREFTKGLDESFGESWASTLIGLLSGSAHVGERGSGADHLFSNEYSFCDRVRNARRRGNQVEWWAEQLKCAETDSAKERWMATAFCWASGSTLRSLFESIDELLESLPKDSISRLSDLAANRGKISRRSFEEVDLPSTWLRKATLASPAVSLFFDRLPAGPQKDRISSKRSVGEIQPELSVKLIQHAWRKWTQGELTDVEVMKISKKFYTPDVFSYASLDVPTSLERRALWSSFEGFLKDVDQLPDMVLVMIEYQARKATRRPKPVLRAAEKGKWFD